MADGQAHNGPAETGTTDQRELLRRVVAELKVARADAAATRRLINEPVAVVGVGCRFPGGVDGLESFWQMLVDGRSGIGVIPDDRWDVDEFYAADPDEPGRTYARHGGFIDGVKEFDAALFGIPPREAVSIDPQHRLVLEVAWQALEHAGIAPDSVRGSNGGVFVGLRGSDYERMGSTDLNLIDTYAATGSAWNFGANRLSYVLGLEGPSMVVDTACSSALVALHLACQSLRAGECDTALAGGVNIMLAPDAMVALTKGRMLSPTGQSRAFDADADGYVRGEGCGMVVLRRLSAAEADGQRILAVIRGSATNQDGKSSGLTVPRGPAQEEVIRQALQRAGVNGTDVGYLEAHGTSTALGDPLEVRALARVLGPGRPAERPLALGSVKTNIGHLEAAAGIAGFIKALLVVQRGTIPPHLNLVNPSPHIPWDELPVTVPTEVTPWPQQRRIAGVSSFGFGGTNAHVVLENPPEQPVAQGDATGPVLVKVSGHTVEAMRAAAGQFATAIEQATDISLAAVGWSANTGRADLAERATVLADSPEHLVTALRAIAADESAPGTSVGRRASGSRPVVAFVAPGHGARIGGTLQHLYGRVPVITEVIDELAEVLGPVDQAPLSTLLSATAEVGTEIVQPATYAAAVALGTWWRSIGVQPDLLLGHSVGAYAAAALAGVFSIQDGARLVAERGRLMGAVPATGAMVSVACPPEQLADLPGDVSIVVYNGPNNTVLAGPADAITAVTNQLTGQGIRCTALPVQHAFHTGHIASVLDDLGAAVANTATQAPHTTFISDTTGEIVDPTTPSYWVEHTRQPVHFDQAVATLLNHGATTVIELGPGGLLPLITGPTRISTTTINARRQYQQLLKAVGQAWTTGTNIGWKALTPQPAAAPDLPSYPFQRKTFWLPPKPTLAGRAAETSDGSGVGLRPRITRAANGEIIAETEISLRQVPFLDEHRVHGRLVVPGVVVIELMLRCAEEVFDDPVTITDLTLSRPLVLTDTETRRLQVILDPVASGKTRVRLYSQDPDSGWHQHVEAAVGEIPPLDESADEGLEPEEFVRARHRCQRFIDHDEFYQEAWHPSFKLGPSFRLVQDAQRGRAAASGILNLPSPESAGAVAGIRPEVLLMDVGVQLIAVAAYAGDDGWDERPVYVGTGYEEMLRYRPLPEGEVMCTAIIRSSAGDEVTGDLLFADNDGQPIVELRGISFRPVSVTLLERLVGGTGSGGGRKARRSGVPRLDLARLRSLGDEPRQRAVLDHLVRLLASVMGSAPDEVDVDAQVTDAADSLMLAELKTAIDAEFELVLPMEVIFQEDRLRDLSRWLADQIRPAEGVAVAASGTAPARPAATRAEPAADARPTPPLGLPRSSGQTAMTVADMAGRAELPAEITAKGEPEAAGVAPDAVLLTGGTGFVGAFLIEELLKRRSGPIYCLVRAEDLDHATRRVRSNLESYGVDAADHLARLVPVVGDLTKPLLGLGQDQFADLHRQVGSIIHCGAVVKWTYPYVGLEAANVSGTREVLRLATVGAPRPVHFISTVGVFSSKDYPHDTVTEAEDLLASGPLVVGYAQSKWVAELMVRTAEKRGVPTTIHRVNTGGHSVTGAYNRMDHLNMMIKGCVEAGVAPDHVAMQLQPAPIDYVAGAVAELSSGLAHRGGTFHLVNEDTMTWGQLFDCVAEFGYPLERLPFDEWRARITGANSGTMALLGLVPFLTDAVDDVKVPVSDTALTRAALAGSGVSCPPLDRTLIHTYLRRFVSSSFVEAPKSLHVAGRTR
jgi:thioester reductase-like protein